MLRRTTRLTAIAVLALLAGACVAAPPEEPVSAPNTSVLRVHSVERHERNVTVRFRSTRCSTAVTGSGFVVSPHEIVTNKHVAGDSVKLEVNTWDGRSYHVTSVRVADDADLALVRVRETLPDQVEIRDEPAKRGSAVIAVGYPRGNQLRFEKGRLVDTVDGSRYGEDNDVEQTTAEVQPGNSGGPLVDEEGRVTGVVFAQLLRNKRGLAIDLDTLKKFLDDPGHVDHVTC